MYIFTPYIHSSTYKQTHNIHKKSNQIKSYLYSQKKKHIKICLIGFLQTLKIWHPQPLDSWTAGGTTEEGSFFLGETGFQQVSHSKNTANNDHYWLVRMYKRSIGQNVCGIYKSTAMWSLMIQKQVQSIGPWVLCSPWIQICDGPQSHKTWKM